jgi:hypothetical protein
LDSSFHCPQCGGLLWLLRYCRACSAIIEFTVTRVPAADMAAIVRGRESGAGPANANQCISAIQLFDRLRIMPGDRMAVIREMSGTSVGRFSELTAEQAWTVLNKLLEIVVIREAS